MPSFDPFRKRKRGIRFLNGLHGRPLSRDLILKGTREGVSESGFCLPFPPFFAVYPFSIDVSSTASQTQKPQENCILFLFPFLSPTSLSYPNTLFISFSLSPSPGNGLSLSPSPIFSIIFTLSCTRLQSISFPLSPSSSVLLLLPSPNHPYISFLYLPLSTCLASTITYPLHSSHPLTAQPYTRVTPPASLRRSSSSPSGPPSSSTAIAGKKITGKKRPQYRRVHSSALGRGRAT